MHAIMPSYYLQDMTGTLYPLTYGSNILGKSPQKCTIILDDRRISRTHCCIQVNEGAVFVEDLHSTNGTYLNGVRLIANKRYSIRPGDIIRLSDFELTLKESVTAATHEQTAYCTNCGNPLTKDPAFCPFCGHPVATEPTTFPSAPPSCDNSVGSLSSPCAPLPLSASTPTPTAPPPQPPTSGHQTGIRLSFLKRWITSVKETRLSRQPQDNGDEGRAAPLAPTLSNVQFAAVAPLHARRTAYTSVNIVMYEEGWKEAVDEIAREHDGPTQTVTSSWTEAGRGTRARVVLTSPELGHIGEREETWFGKYLRFCFTFKVPEATPDNEILIDATIYFNDVPATHLSLVLEAGPNQQSVTTRHRHDITSAFLSYASEDRERVAVIAQGIEAARPDLDLFLDVENLRSGDNWKSVLDVEIRRRDLLFLCWSRAASSSEWVDYEWRQAYAEKGVGGIEPVAIEPPELCPPPEELKSMHFNSRLLYIANSR